MGCGHSKENIKEHKNKKGNDSPGDILQIPSRTSTNSSTFFHLKQGGQQGDGGIGHQGNHSNISHTPAPSPSGEYENSSHNSSNKSNSNSNKSMSKKPNLALDTSHDSTNSINNNNNNNHNSMSSINSIGQKRPSLLSLSNESSLNDITVNIPDPFRSNYKVTDSLYHKNFRKLYRGIDKNRREVLVEFTELRPYESAGHTQVDFFNRIDILRQLDHISIPKILDVFDGAEVNRVVFDYFPGKDLDCLLKMKGSLPPHVSFYYCQIHISS